MSLFQLISLYDDISIRYSQSTAIEIHGSFPFPDEENTIWRAATLFRQKTGFRRGVTIRVRKRIPYGAGLGGGSSDAAAVLMALNGLSQAQLSPSDLQSLGLEIGSDVPFFIGPSAAIVSGRGEIVHPLVPRADYLVLLAYPGFPIDTSLAYSLYDERGGSRQKGRSYSEEELRKSYRRDRIDTWRFHNAFQPVLEERFPVLSGLTARMREEGALHAAVTGSGSTLIGLFQSPEKGRDAWRKMSRIHPFVRLAEPLEMRPSPVLQ
jgi:4-diphosphocytidyl-2-C-methyl-D-erythritol kinase